MTQVSESLLTQMNEAVRAGQGQVARSILRTTNLSKVLRKHRPILANIARRADLPNLAVALLNPLIRPSAKKQISAATDTEKAEYAAALTSIGATEEAIEMLKEVDPVSVPASLLYRAFAYFGTWDYEAALPLLERYVQSPAISEYECLVGKVNLAASLVQVGHLEQAESLLCELQELTKSRSYRLLQGNTLEIRAQGAIRMKDWKLAERLLTEGRDALASSESLGGFFIRKWEVILSLLSKTDASSSLQPLAKIRSEATALQHWETLRDLDFIYACATCDDQAALHVYAGTPFSSFRKRLLSEFPLSLEIPSTYAWRSSSKGKATQTMNLIDGKVGGRQTIEVGQVPHRLLRILVSDFYHPLRVPSLFAKLYPGEFYDPIHSPVRVHQAMKRLRIWMDEIRLPLWVEESNGLYKLMGRGLELVIPTDSRVGTAEELICQRLKSVFPEHAFSTQDICQTLGVTERTAQRVVRRLLPGGLISKVGKGMTTRYRI